MAGKDESASMPFVNFTSMTKPDPETRKLIRSHCMLGKNRGRILHSRRKDKEAAITWDSTTGPLNAQVTPSIPKKLGSELSLLQFADPIEPSTLYEVLKFTSFSKRTSFPLERCFDFNTKDRSLFEPLTSDPAFLNTVVFGAQAYLDLASGRMQQGCLTKRSSLRMLKTIQLLRTRLSMGNEQTRISNTTISIVLTLAHISHFMRDHATGLHHLEGLYKIVNLRGGIATFQDNPKLLTELLRCDINMAIYGGSKPIFDLNHSSKSSPRFTLQSILLPSASMALLGHQAQYQRDRYATGAVSEELIAVWGHMSRFCCLVNSAVEERVRLHEKILLETMGSVMYPLLVMGFPSHSVNEAVRLGLLALSSHIFLERRGLHMPQQYLCDSYKNCIDGLGALEGGLSQIMLWFLMIGAICIFKSNPDERAWIISCLRQSIELHGISSWAQLRTTLKSFLWIDVLCDGPGEAIFETIL